MDGTKQAGRGAENAAGALGPQRSSRLISPCEGAAYGACIPLSCIGKNLCPAKSAGNNIVETHGGGTHK